MDFIFSPELDTWLAAHNQVSSIQKTSLYHLGMHDINIIFEYDFIVCIVILDSMCATKILTRTMEKGKPYQRVIRKKLYRIHNKTPVRKDIFRVFGQVNLCDIYQISIKSPFV